MGVGYVGQHLSNYTRFNPRLWIAVLAGAFAETFSRFFCARSSFISQLSSPLALVHLLMMYFVSSLMYVRAGKAGTSEVCPRHLEYSWDYWLVILLFSCRTYHHWVRSPHHRCDSRSCCQGPAYLEHPMLPKAWAGILLNRFWASGYPPANSSLRRRRRLRGLIELITCCTASFGFPSGTYLTRTHSSGEQYNTNSLCIHVSASCPFIDNLILDPTILLIWGTGMRSFCLHEVCLEIFSVFHPQRFCSTLRDE